MFFSSFFLLSDLFATFFFCLTLFNFFSFFLSTKENQEMKRAFLIILSSIILYIHVEQRDIGDREKRGREGGFRVCARARHKAWSMVTDFSSLLTF
jgi:hypothetical protein